GRIVARLRLFVRPIEARIRRCENRGEVQLAGADARRLVDLLEHVDAADDLAQATHAKAGQDLADLRGQEGEVVDHHVRRAGELRPQVLALRGAPRWTGAEDAL